ncbi:hypothetical protein AYM40_12215 [Paraburkholderia phytofirmans OLGA172]|uniref:Uncharacterized protein n=1 Tax=Paraburkholderia phytofirmans OLGA172 TaxID=1417228 RepID=A0A167VZY9_9BURK|nr:hypothetical protein AYM40_12215 [Paraburkholderia phytofirmans OLGA172]
MFEERATIETHTSMAFGFVRCSNAPRAYRLVNFSGCSRFGEVVAAVARAVRPDLKASQRRYRPPKRVLRILGFKKTMKAMRLVGA